MTKRWVWIWFAVAALALVGGDGLAQQKKPKKGTTQTSKTTKAPTKSKAALEAERAKLQAEMARTKARLQGIQRQKSATMEELATLQDQISTREEIISLYGQELKAVDKQMRSTALEINELSEERKRLQTSYARLVRYAYKNRFGYQKLIFLFSASSFNQAWNRFKYLTQYTRYRKRQAELIVLTQKALAERIVELGRHRNEKKLILGEQKQEKESLAVDAQDRQVVVSKLQRDEEALADNLRSQQQAARRITSAIETVVRRNARNSGSSSGSSSSASGRAGNTEIEAKLSSSFSGNKRKLPWPIGGRIVKSFGVHPHPVLKGVNTRNDGVDIRAKGAGPVKSVFEGEVTGVVTVPGMQRVVIIRHGEYLTVYAHLEAVAVTMGQKVSVGSPIGTLYESEESRSYELHFELWKGTNKLNPAQWLK